MLGWGGAPSSFGPLWGVPEASKMSVAFHGAFLELPASVDLLAPLWGPSVSAVSSDSPHGTQVGRRWGRAWSAHGDSASQVGKHCSLQTEALTACRGGSLIRLWTQRNDIAQYLVADAQPCLRCFKARVLEKHRVWLERRALHMHHKATRNSSIRSTSLQKNSAGITADQRQIPVPCLPRASPSVHMA